MVTDRGICVWSQCTWLTRFVPLLRCWTNTINRPIPGLHTCVLLWRKWRACANNFGRVGEYPMQLKWLERWGASLSLNKELLPIQGCNKTCSYNSNGDIGLDGAACESYNKLYKYGSDQKNRMIAVTILINNEYRREKQGQMKKR